MIAYYYVNLILSVMLTGIYIWKWHRHFPPFFSPVFTIIPISQIGYLWLALAHNEESALRGIALSYIGGLYLNVFILLIILSLCHVNVPKWLMITLLSISTAIYGSVLSSGHLPLFYKGVEIYYANGMAYLKRDYGVMHTVFYVSMVVYIIACFAVAFYGARKKDVSGRVVILLAATVIIPACSFFANVLLGRDLEWVSAFYVIIQICYLLVLDRLCLYYVDETVIDSMINQGENGYVAVDFKYRYLGSNSAANSIFPEIDSLKIDRPITENEYLKETIVKYIDDFAADNSKNSIMYKRGNRIYKVQVNYLFDGNRKRGYHVFFNDDTKQQNYIRKLNDYNSDLESEVKKKTVHLQNLQDKMVLGLAVMVEGRDNSTGGHINRTSEVVSILAEELRKDESLKCDDEFLVDLIKAAPMHDLGKIAVDDVVLRKPGKYDEQEFSMMKEHAAKGAAIVRRILAGVTDIRFREIAENVAHYHHERWDGSGYPDGLKGENIPLEARIMAIADVYDALVSRRCYKEKMSYEEAFEHIKEGMGRHFDPKLFNAFEASRERLEAYYDSLPDDEK